MVQNVTVKEAAEIMVKISTIRKDWDAKGVITDWHSN